MKIILIPFSLEIFENSKCEHFLTIRRLSSVGFIIICYFQAFRETKVLLVT